MKNSFLAKAGLLAFCIVLLVVICWEFYLRGKGFNIFYNDDPALWTYQRDRVYEPADQSTVFIGSSRIKFDLDIPTWESITGDQAVQLACVGSTPIPILENLANDKEFKGRLVVDVTEGLFFSTAPDNAKRPDENLKYYKERTPAQQAGFYINRILESNFVFLDKQWLSLNASLDKIFQLKNRPGVYQFPGFPTGFGRVNFNRQEYLTNQFSADTIQQNIVKNIWRQFIKASKEPPASGTKLDSILMLVKTSVDKIKARGGQVIFVRTPSSGGFKMGESMGFPREKYWERLLASTGCPGIHYADYPAIDHFICPEDSHLSLSDAKVFTVNFINILREKGWSFPNMPVAKK